MRRLVLLPAVDVVGGLSVRLVQGQEGSEIVHGSPSDSIGSFVDEGASWIHLVDVDAAFGRPDNGALIAEVVRRFREHVHIELAGGITTEPALRRALETGCQRVVLGTAALRDRDWTRQVIEDNGDRVALSLDVKGQRLSARAQRGKAPNSWRRWHGSMISVVLATSSPTSKRTACCAVQTLHCSAKCAV